MEMEAQHFITYTPGSIPVPAVFPCTVHGNGESPRFKKKCVCNKLIVKIYHKIAFHSIGVYWPFVARFA
jgi:hypothetical protein